MRHQHTEAEAHGIGLAGSDPAPDLSDQLCPVPLKDLRAQAVAGGPVVDEGQKTLDFPQAALIVPDLSGQEGVQLVFLQQRMRQLVQKTRGLLRAAQTAREASQLGRAPAEDAFGQEIRDQPRQKVGVLLIAQRQQLFPDAHGFFTLP